MQTTIKTLTRWITACIRIAVLTVFILPFAACSSSDDPAPEKNDDTVFTLRIVTQKSSSTRAWVSDDRIGNEAENRINIQDKDFRVYLFDREEKYQQLINGYMEVVENTTETIYILKGYIQRHLVTFNASGVTYFTLLVLANWREWGAFYPEPAAGTLLSSVMADCNQTFSIDGSAWTPCDASNPKKGIPMFGYHRFTMSKAQAEKSTEESPHQFNVSNGNDDLYLLRSMAKIEVVDAMEKWEEGDEYPYIQSVSTDSYMPEGRLVPHSKVWAGNGKQVSGISLLSGTGMTTAALSFAKTKDYDPNGVRILDQTFFNRDAFVAYLPEQDYRGLTEGPMMTVKVVDHNDATKTGEKHLTYKLDLSKVINFREIESEPELRRNHVYRLELSIAPTELVVHCKIKNWEPGGIASGALK